MPSLPVPPPGQRTRVGGLVGSSDALALAGVAASRKPLAVFTASAGDGQRLVHEIALLRPRAARAPAAGLGNAALRQLLPAPGPGIRAARDAVPDLAPGLRRHRRAGHHGAVPPAAGRVSRRPTASSSSRARRSRPEALRKQLILAGYQHVTQVVSPGEFSFRGGLIDLFPMGSAAALPRRPARQRGRQHPHLRRGHAALDLQGQGRAAAAGARVPHRRGRAHALPPELPREVRGRPVPQPALQGREQRRVRGGRSSTTCRCSSSTPRCSPTICRRARWSACTATCTEAIESFWRDTRSRFDLLRGDRDRPLLPPAELFLSLDQFFGAVKPFARHRDPARRRGRDGDTAVAGRDRCRRCRSTGAQTTRCTGCAISSTPSPAAP